MHARSQPTRTRNPCCTRRAPCSHLTHVTSYRKLLHMKKNLRKSEPTLGSETNSVADRPMENPTISVVIPAKNEALNLPSVLADLPDGLLEVILVDGRSTDDTVAVARAHRPDIKVIGQSRKGKGNAKAFDAQVRQARDSFWSALGEPFFRLVLDLDAEDLDATAREALAAGWCEASRRAAALAFEAVADAQDANADALRRAAEARRFFYGRLKKLLP